jgi:hypothetical protein
LRAAPHRSHAHPVRPRQLRHDPPQAAHAVAIVIAVKEPPLLIRSALWCEPAYAASNSPCPRPSPIRPTTAPPTPLSPRTATEWGKGGERPGQNQYPNSPQRYSLSVSDHNHDSLGAHHPVSASPGRRP